jgi:general secretion pathway protein D
MLPLYGSRRSRLRRKLQQPAQETQKNITLAYNDLPHVIENEISKKVSVKEDTQFVTFEEKLTTEQMQEQEHIVQEEAQIELYFEDADLKNFIEQIEDIFDVIFITDDALEPAPQASKPILGNKISYRTNKPITQSQAWNIFNTFLNIAGFAIVPHPTPKTYQITSIDKAKKSSINAFIGTNVNDLPEEEFVRYVYFVKNTTVQALQPIIESLRSTTSDALPLPEHQAYLITDTGYNIKVLINIIQELDKVSMPQSMSVVKLIHVDAKYVKELYDELIQKPQTGQNFMLNKKQPTTLLPENARIIVEPRTNALILLGPQNALDVIEKFIVSEIDVDPLQPYSPVHIHQLKHADAETIANVLNKTAQFGAQTDVGKSGGIRAGDKYLQPMSFVAEKATNRLVINGQYDDYLQIKDIIEDLDKAQPQIVAEILILAIDAQTSKELGTQLRSKAPGGTDGFLGKNIEFQTSGLRAGGSASGIITSDSENGTQRLLGNLLEVVTGKGVGNTVVSLGKDLFGVWGVFDILETVTNTEVISNPFLIATNNTPASVSLGEIRRVVSATIVGGSDNNVDARDDDKAELSVELTPQINSDGMILLNLTIKIDNFVNSQDFTSATKQTRLIKTSTIIADKEILALGGLIRNDISNDMSKTPILGDIPILGWFFKNKRKQERKTNLLVLISTQILQPEDRERINKYTSAHIDDYEGDLGELRHLENYKDPIHKTFFAETRDRAEETVDNFIFRRKNANIRSRKNKRWQRKKIKEKQKMIKLAQQQLHNKALPVEHKLLTTKQPQLLAQNDNTKLKNMLQTKKRTNLSLSSLVANNKSEQKQMDRS